MANLKAIRKRIASVKATQKTTRAMKMVSAAKLRRASEAIQAIRPYERSTTRMLRHCAKALHNAGDTPHPLLAERKETQALVILFTSDRGLAGAFNANAIKQALTVGRDLNARGVKPRYAALGKKGRDALRRENLAIDAELSERLLGLSAENLEHGDVGAAANALVTGYHRGAIDRCTLVFNEFHSAIRQTVSTRRILPVTVDEPECKADNPLDFVFEPSASTVIETLVPMAIHTELLRALFESTASEHGARMSTMDAATKNAKEMIDRLTLEFNRARQAAITRELVEIISGAETLQG